MLGEKDSFGAGSFDFWLVKNDTNGIAEWNQTYGGPNDDHPNSLVKTMDGGLVLLGSIDPPDRYNYSYYIVKIGGESLVSQSPQTVLLFSFFILLGAIVVIFVWRRKRY
ncbi:MAG: hypothetical protein ACFFB2_11310 [Promethearchaeota archaeon]